MLKAVRSMKSVLKVLEKYWSGWICRSNKICFLPFSITFPAELNRHKLSCTFLTVLCLPDELLPDVGTGHSWDSQLMISLQSLFYKQILFCASVDIPCHFLLPAIEWEKKMNEKNLVRGEVSAWQPRSSTVFYILWASSAAPQQVLCLHYLTWFHE